MQSSGSPGPPSSALPSASLPSTYVPRVGTSFAPQGLPIGQGIRLLWIASLVYAICAAVGASSAGLYVTAVRLAGAGDPTTGAYNAGGAVSFEFGLVVALVALVLFLAGWVRSWGERAAWGHTPPRWLTLSHVGFWLGCGGLLSSGAWLWLLAYSSLIRAQGQVDFPIVRILGVALLAVTALGYLVAIGLPPLFLGRDREVTFARLAWILGILGLVGLVAVGLRATAMTEAAASDYLTSGGFPLVNTNLPFGAVVAVSAALFAWSYRRLSRRLAGFRLPLTPTGEPTWIPPP